MPIPAIPIVVGILASAGGLSLGALIRQPQINALKAQVTKLQEELGRMQTLCNNVMKDIEILKLRMQMQQNEDLLTQLKGQEDLNIGQLVYAYGLKEYLEIKQSYLIEGKDISETEAVFADTFAGSILKRMPQMPPPARVSAISFIEALSEYSSVGTFDSCDAGV